MVLEFHRMGTFPGIPNLHTSTDGNVVCVHVCESGRSENKAKACIFVKLYTCKHNIASLYMIMNAYAHFSLWH